MEAAHLDVVPLIVVLAAPPGFLLIDNVVNPLAMVDDEAMAAFKAVAVDRVDILRGRGRGMPP